MIEVESCSSIEFRRPEGNEIDLPSRRDDGTVLGSSPSVLKTICWPFAEHPSMRRGPDRRDTPKQASFRTRSRDGRDLLRCAGVVTQGPVARLTMPVNALIVHALCMRKWSMACVPLWHMGLPSTLVHRVRSWARQDFFAIDDGLRRGPAIDSGSPRPLVGAAGAFLAIDDGLRRGPAIDSGSPRPLVGAAGLLRDRRRPPTGACYRLWFTASARGRGKTLRDRRRPPTGACYRLWFTASERGRGKTSSR